MDIGPGDLVVCVRDIFHHDPADIHPVVGRVYTVADIHCGCPNCGVGDGALALQEVSLVGDRVCLCGDYREHGIRYFNPDAFRPIPKEQRELIRRLAVDDRERVPA